MTKTLTPSPESLVSQDLVVRLRDDLTVIRPGRPFFPTVRVREVCGRIRTTTNFPDADRLSLYKAAALTMLEQLNVRAELVSKERRPRRLVGALAAAVAELPERQADVLLLHLMVGFSPAEIASLTGDGDVRDPLDRGLAVLSARLRAATFTLDDLYASGIGPVGDVTRVLERVRRGEGHLSEVLVANWQELLRVAKTQKIVRHEPGFDAPEDVLSEAVRKILAPRAPAPEDDDEDRGEDAFDEGVGDALANPESAPQNRKELHAFVSKIMRGVVADSARRVIAAKRGGGAIHRDIEDALETPLQKPDDRDALLDAIGDALERTVRVQRRGPVSAAQAVEAQLAEALFTLQAQHPRRYRVLRLRLSSTIEEVAEQMDISPATVKRDWHEAIAFLRRAVGR